jgi:recombinational DNA repair ATPase RecF
MIKLTKAIVHKYKCIEQSQVITIEPDITVFVGMNESGKTSLLEALAKVNYFEDDKDFKFNMIRDYPRKQKKERIEAVKFLKLLHLNILLVKIF